MEGDAVLWIPGFDHAGIATQTVVERTLKPRTRHDLGREAFEELAWNWSRSKKREITTQLSSLGLSLHWHHEFFTLSPEHNAAVTEAFVRMWQAGLIRRVECIVSWCCTLQSVISDIEVELRTLEDPTLLPVPGYSRPISFGKLDSFDYRLADNLGGEETLTVATTRLETMLGDTALCVHPEDDRYARFVGRRVSHPFFPDRLLPIVADAQSVNIAKGTGVVKLSPGHSAIDFEVARRHNLPVVNMLDDRGCVDAASPFDGMPRYDAREAIREQLREKGLWRSLDASSEPQQLPVCSRTGDIVEPRVKKQWFLSTKEMAAKALNAVDVGNLQLYPGYHEAVWREWLAPEKQRDWCISRQLWWGHRIPAFRPCDNSGAEIDWIAASSKEDAARLLNISVEKVVQDEDVLDTWFSSALLPLSSLGWPKNADGTLFKRYFPMRLLETGQDILFFWVARMVMLCQALTGQLPFSEVMLHGLVKDSTGKKMSKSRGNVIDPLKLVHGTELSQTSVKTSLGADSLRFGLLSLASDQPAVNFSPDALRDASRFCNKIWQTFRYLQPLCVFTRDDLLETDRGLQQLSMNEGSLSDRWVLYELRTLIAKVNDIICPVTRKNSADAFLYHVATKRLRNWWTEDLCSVYLELVKRRNVDDAAHGLRTLQLSSLTGLRLLHPFLPHLTEVVWQSLLPEQDAQLNCLALQRYPKESWLGNVHFSEEDQQTMKLLLDVCRQVKDWKRKLHLTRLADQEIFVTSPMEEDVIPSLTGLSCEVGPQRATGFISIPLSHPGFCLNLPKDGSYIEKAVSDLELRLARVEEKLAKNRSLTKSTRQIEAKRLKLEADWIALDEQRTKLQKLFNY